MSLLDDLECFLILGPILLLFALGLVLTLRSGVADLSTGQGMRRMVGNLYHTLLMVGGCLIGLALIQQMVGLHIGLVW
jgi:hypothetical protein